MRRRRRVKEPHLVHTVIKKLGMTKKKAKMYGAPHDLEAKTLAFCKTRGELRAQGFEFLSIDETSFGRNFSPSFGYSPRGQKLYVRKKQPRVTTRSVVACVSKSGWLGTTCITGSFNTDRFLTFLKSLNLSERHVVLMDNVSFHHNRSVKDYLASINVTVLYTPPYSPWYNPIESCFSIAKRAFAQGKTIDESFASVTAAHCQAFFAKSLTCVSPF